MTALRETEALREAMRERQRQCERDSDSDAAALRHLTAGLPSLKRDGDPYPPEAPPQVHTSEPVEAPSGGPSEHQQGAPKLLQLSTLLQVANE